MALPLLLLLPILLQSVSPSNFVPCSEVYGSAPVNGLTALYGPVVMNTVASRLVYPDPVLQLPSILNNPTISITFWLKLKTQTTQPAISRQNFLLFNSSSTDLAFQISYDPVTQTTIIGSEVPGLDSNSPCRLEITYSLPANTQNWLLISLAINQTGLPTFMINGTNPGPLLSSTNCKSVQFAGLSYPTAVWLQGGTVSLAVFMIYDIRLYDRAISASKPSTVYQNQKALGIFPSSVIKSGFRFYRSQNDTIRTTTSTMDTGELLFDGPIRPSVTSALNLDQQFNQGLHQFLIPQSASFWISFWIKLDTPVPSGSFSRGVLQIINDAKVFTVSTWIRQIQDVSTIVLEHVEDTPICSMVTSTVSTRLPADNQYHHIFIGSRAPTVNSTKRIWTICVDSTLSCSSSALVSNIGLFDKTLSTFTSTACSTSAPSLTFLLRQLRVKEFTDSTFDFTREQAKAKAISFNEDCAISANGDTSLFPPPLCYGRGVALANGTCQCNYDRESGTCRKCGTNFAAFEAYGDPYYSCSCPPGYGLSNPAQTCDPCQDGYYSSQSNSVCVACRLPSAVYSNRTQCGICPAGTYTNTLRGVCIDCSPGTYSSTAGSSSCSVCPAGTYSNLTSCTSCPSGQVSSSGSSGCSKCSDGTVPSPDSSSCITCADGTVVDIVSGTCASCSAGKYRQGSMTSCQTCPTGRVSVENRTTCVGCDKGTFTNDNIRCMPCPRGYFSNETGLGSCFQCDSGYVSAPSGQSCETCLAGTHSSPDRSVCVSCPVGQYSSFSASDTCSDCAPGRYAEATGQTECIQCPLGSYTSDFSSSKCTNCPVNTFSNKIGLNNCTSCQAYSTATDVGSTSQDACLCLSGFFHNKTADSRGYICDPCPAEFVCTSLGIVYPGLHSGYYRDLNQPYTALKCSPEEACVGTRENNSTLCATGYEGYRCSSCSNQYYRYEAKCIGCGSGVLGPMALVVLLIIGCALILQTAQPSKHPLSSIGISFSNLQLISVFGLSITNRWNSSVSSSFGTISILNLNISMFRPECSLGMDFWQRQRIQFFLPLIALFLLAVLSLARYLYYSITMNMSGSTGGLLKEETKHRFVYACVILMLHGYTVAIATATDPLSCEDAGGGRHFMKKDPTIECSGADYYQNIERSLLVFAAYASVIPIALSSVLLFHYNNSSLFTDKFERSFGALTSPYNSNCFWWEIVNLLRKLLVVLATNLLQSIYMQLFVILSLLFVAMVLQIFCYPYRTLEENRLSIMWNIVAILILFSAGVLEAGGAQSGSESLTLEIMIFVSLFLTGLYSLYTVWTEIQIRGGRPMKTVASDIGNPNDPTDTSFFVSDHGAGFITALEGLKSDHPAVVGPTSRSARSTSTHFRDAAVKNPPSGPLHHRMQSNKTYITHTSAKDGEQAVVEALTFIDEADPQPENFGNAALNY